MTSLRELDISENHSLSSISESLFSISTLEEVKCEDCDALTSPPLAVCQQGVNAVRKYFSDLKIDQDSNPRLIPVTVIGKSGAGKTSLVRSIQQDKRVLTVRDPDNEKLDEATRVFNVCEATVSNSSKLIFADFGGHRVYHLTYQLTFKTQCVPLLVIDISEFDRRADRDGPESACRELCIEWLSHLYLTCRRLRRPVVVLTHCDKVSDECFQLRRKQLADESEKLRRRIVETETNVGMNNSALSIASFTDLTEPLFIHSEMIAFSDKSSQADIESLKQVLTDAGFSLLTEIPESWYRILHAILEQSDKLFIMLSEMDEEFPDDKNHVALQYLHNSGRLMWFRTKDGLSNIIFHRAEVITAALKVIYNHTHEKAWRVRLDQFKPFSASGRVIERNEYEGMIQSFTEFGVMDGILLMNLLETESDLPPKLSVEVLKAFHLVHSCGPSNAETFQKYVFPYFAKKQVVQQNIYYDNAIPLKADIVMRGLPVPSYIFSQITAMYLNMNSDPPIDPEVGSNGASVTTSNGMVKYLLHNTKESRVTLITRMPMIQILEGWQDLLNVLKQLIRELNPIWRGIQFESVFYCSHCLHIKDQSPTTTVDPEWFKEYKYARRDHVGVTYTGNETFQCRNTQVPKPLMVPCKLSLVFTECDTCILKIIRN